jgi:hypothetical protein
MKRILNVKKVFAALAVVLSVAQAQAGDCYIRITRVCPLAPTLKPNIDFVDNNLLAKTDAVRCAERAQDYKDWCNSVRKNAGLEVVASYWEGNKGVLGSYTAADGKTYLMYGSRLNFVTSKFSK